MIGLLYLLRIVKTKVINKSLFLFLYTLINNWFAVTPENHWEVLKMIGLLFLLRIIKTEVINNSLFLYTLINNWFAETPENHWVLSSTGMFKL